MIFLLICTITLAYCLVYWFYLKYIGPKVFKLNNHAAMPSQFLSDGSDYIPTNKWIVMGHHFTSIAGTGPIVGPAIGIIWGWVPALCWVVFGSILIGAFHDLFALVLSVRHQGKSLSEVASRVIHPVVKIWFMALICLLLLLVIAIFGLVIAIIFARFPESVIPVFFEILISVLFFKLIKHFPNKLILVTIFCLICMVITILIGHVFPISLGSFLGLPATGLWTIILLLYAFIASILPVNILLQPRDYLNAWQLVIVLSLLVLSTLLLCLTKPFNFVAPAVNLQPVGAPSPWPFLFITIACGAISGFHCLVSSGTSSKQLEKETDAVLVGAGSMLLEGALAVMVILAVGAGIGLGYPTESNTLIGQEAWLSHYASWESSSGLSSKIEAVVIGFANILSVLGFSQQMGILIIGVFIASFAGTTLDTATRLQRYVLTEFIESSLGFRLNKWIATSIAVLGAFVLAFASGANGKGALMLWPLFGVGNQLIAVIAFMVFTMYLISKKSKYSIYTLVVTCFLASVVLSGMFVQSVAFFEEKKLMLLFMMGFLGLVLTITSFISIFLFLKHRKGSV